MYYYGIKRNKTEYPRIAGNLIRLKDALTSQIPPKSAGNTLLATWNIREFDSKAYGDRGVEPLHYIAEIMSRFDLIAVQEVREDLTALKKVVDILGNRHWDYIVSDVSEGTPGNRERMAFVYDKRHVSFSSIAGEVVIPPIEVKEGRKTLRYDPSDQLYRTPYLCGFQLGWSKLLLCTVHILFGDGGDENDPKRVREIKLIADALAKRSRERQDYSNLVLLGDFNIFSRDDLTMKAITDAGFVVDESLQSVPETNVGKKARFYDQIAFKPKGNRFESTGEAGVFDFFDVIYRDEDEKIYKKAMGPAYLKTSSGKKRENKSLYYKTYWRTHQMSDHLPMWIQLRTDFSREYLEELQNETPET